MITRLFAVLAFLFAVTSAQAQVGWSAAGTACVPNGPTVGKYTSVGAAGVRHAGNNVGSLVFTCSMDRFNSGTTTWVLRLAYRDSTGAAGTASVIARIYHMDKEGFTPVLLATANSNSSSSTGKVIVSSGDFNHTFDFEQNVYFVQVMLSRSAGNQIVQFHSVVLEAATL
jgi:hypothetical protein